MNILAMTPAALLHFLALATQHALTDEETRLAVRLACGERRSCVSLVDVEAAISDVLATRVTHVSHSSTVGRCVAAPSLSPQRSVQHGN